MRSAKTAEERQKLAEANRAEIEKRAKEKGITLPEAHGPGGHRSALGVTRDDASHGAGVTRVNIQAHTVQWEA